MLGSGVTERLDIGLEPDLSTLVSWQAKYQVLGTKTSLFAGSIAAEGGLAVLPSLIAGPYYTFSVPFTLSYHPSTDDFYGYVQPVYYFSQRQIRTGKQLTEKYTAYGLGISYGFAIGTKNRFSLEIGHYDDLIHMPFQVTVGYTASFRW